MSFAIIVLPVKDGNGYIGKCGKFQTWAVDRITAIEDILKIVAVEL